VPRLASTQPTNPSLFSFPSSHFQLPESNNLLKLKLKPNPEDALKINLPSADPQSSSQLNFHLMAKLLLASLSPLSFCIEKEWKTKVSTSKASQHKTFISLDPTILSGF
jgi:hypothetical protein